MGGLGHARRHSRRGLLALALSARHVRLRQQPRERTFARLESPRNGHAPPLVALAFWIGVYPKPFFALIEKPVDTIVRQVNPGFYQQERAKLPPAPAPVVAEAK